MNKQPKNISEQIQLLKSRGLLFKNEVAAINILSNISYYRLKGYWWEMQEDPINHRFKKNNYFEDAVILYNFDSRFRLIVFSAIERIEIALRAKMIYHFSLEYGPCWHLNPDLFQKNHYFNEFQMKLNNDLKNSREVFIKEHYKKHPNENPESWKALEVLPLGTLSKLYKNLKHQLPEKNTIAKEFGLYNQKHFSSWLAAITLIRNIIAHHGRLWNRELITRYDWPDKTMAPLLLSKPDGSQRGKLFSMLSAMIYMNNFINSERCIKKDLCDLFNKFEKVPLSKIGFPKNWKKEPIWE